MPLQAVYFAGQDLPLEEIASRGQALAEEHRAQYLNDSGVKTLAEEHRYLNDSGVNKVASGEKVSSRGGTPTRDRGGISWAAGAALPGGRRVANNDASPVSRPVKQMWRKVKNAVFETKMASLRGGRFEETFSPWSCRKGEDS